MSINTPKKPREPKNITSPSVTGIEGESILELDEPAGVVSMTEATGLYAAMPDTQDKANALNALVNTNAVVVPPVSDIELNDETERGKKNM